MSKEPAEPRPERKPPRSPSRRARAYQWYGKFSDFSMRDWWNDAAHATLRNEKAAVFWERIRRAPELPGIISCIKKLQQLPAGSPSHARLRPYFAFTAAFGQLETMALEVLVSRSRSDFVQLDRDHTTKPACG